ncbi:hypothetical protein E4U54_003294 [Claviceps lovelessii]|nr:hypothetical protein E4U54_003294 [Claviceps lovelessii]
MPYYFQPPIFAVQPVITPVVQVTTAVQVSRPAVYTVAVQPPTPPVVYVLPAVTQGTVVSDHDGGASSPATADTTTDLPVSSRRPTLRIVFYGHSATSSEAPEPRPRPIWRRTLDHSFSTRPTLASFKESIPRLAAQAGVTSTTTASGSGSLTWHSAIIFVLYPHTNGAIDIGAGEGPVRNGDMVRELGMVSPSAGAGASGAGDMASQVQQGDWDAYMERWERGQVRLHGVVCMDGPVNEG